MALSWPTILAMTLFPAIVGKGKPTHLQLVPPSKQPAPPPIPQSVADGTATDPTVTHTVIPARSTMVDRDTAITEFWSIMMDCGAGGSLAFRHIARNYAELGATAGWPPLKDKSLSMALTRRGCRKHVGSRQKDGSRPTILTFPKAKKPRALQ